MMKNLISRHSLAKSELNSERDESYKLDFITIFGPSTEGKIAKFSLFLVFLVFWRYYSS